MSRAAEQRHRLEEQVQAANERAVGLQRQLAECQAERDAYKRDAIAARETQLIDERRAIEALRDGDALAAQLAKCQEERAGYQREAQSWRADLQSTLEERDALVAQLAECQERAQRRLGILRRSTETLRQCSAERDALTALAGELRTALEELPFAVRGEAHTRYGESEPITHKNRDSVMMDAMCMIVRQKTKDILALTPAEALARQQVEGRKEGEG